MALLDEIIHIGGHQWPEEHVQNIFWVIALNPEFAPHIPAVIYVMMRYASLFMMHFNHGV